MGIESGAHFRPVGVLLQCVCCGDAKFHCHASDMPIIFITGGCLWYVTRDGVVPVMVNTVYNANNVNAGIFAKSEP